MSPHPKALQCWFVLDSLVGGATPGRVSTRDAKGNAGGGCVRNSMSHAECRSGDAGSGVGDGLARR